MISASLSLSLPRLGWKSTSTPRSLKICTAAGDSASEMRTLGLDMRWVPLLDDALDTVVPGKREARLCVGGPSCLMDGRVKPGHDDDGTSDLRRLRERGL